MKYSLKSPEGAPRRGRATSILKGVGGISPHHRSKSDPENYFAIEITIAIENLIRINQALIFIFQSRFDGKIFSRP